MRKLSALGLLALAGLVVSGCQTLDPSSAQEKVVYHVNDSDNATAALRNIGNHLEATDGKAKIVVVTHAKGVDFLLKKNKVDVIWGTATIAAPGKVTVTAADNPPKGALGGGDYTAKHIIVATGARPRVLPGLEPDKKLVWTYFEAMAPDKMPKSLLVVGSGAIGIEFASFYGTMGGEVTVVELLPQILPVEDEEIAAHARKRFEKQGIKDPDGRQGGEAGEGRG